MGMRCPDVLVQSYSQWENSVENNPLSSGSSELGGKYYTTRLILLLFKEFIECVLSYFGLQVTDELPWSRHHRRLSGLVRRAVPVYCEIYALIYALIDRCIAVYCGIFISVQHLGLCKHNKQ